jgi:coatomer subunit delta
MVVVAAGVCTRRGKLLVSRQFVEISRSRVEGLWAAFPKLLEAEGKQHSYIETESVRYVYQPLEALYVLILTTKSSNILEDLETLQLLAKLVGELCYPIDESGVSLAAFDIVFAFDEAIALGYREKVTMQQIQTFTAMDSQEEKIHEMIERNKRREALEMAKRRQYEIEQARSHGNDAYDDYQRSHAISENYVSMASLGASQSSSSSMSPSPSSSSSSSSSRISSLKLAGASAQNEFEKSLQRDGVSLAPRPPIGNVAIAAPASSPPAAAAAAGAQAAAGASPATAKQRRQRPPIDKKSVHIEVNERISATVSRDEGLRSLKVLGDLMLVIGDAASSNIAVKLQGVDEAREAGFVLQIHPNIGRPAFEKGVLALRDASRSFPVDNPLGVLKWRLTTSDESALPLAITCWPSDLGDSRSRVNLDFELRNAALRLEELVITIPIPSGGAPVINEIDQGSTNFDARASSLLWHVPVVDAELANGRLEFDMTSPDHDGLFPIDIDFDSPTPMCPTLPVAVASNEGKKLEFSLQKSLVVASPFRIE